MKASQAEKEKDCYLSVDQYTRGKVEKQILGISQKNKVKKAKQKNKGRCIYYKLTLQWAMED